MKVTNLKTVGELKEFLKKFSDDTKLMHYESNMENSGYKLGLIVCDEPQKLYKRENFCIDAFDGTEYTTESYTTTKGYVCDLEEVEAIIF